MDNAGTLIRLTLIALYFSTGQLHATNPCNTKECNKIASDILKKMDIAIDPCDDFFMYSCGSFLKQEIPPRKTSIGSFETLEDITTEQVSRIIRGNMSTSPRIAKRLIETFYATCTSSDHETHRSKRPLLDDFEKIGGFPALNPNWNESNFQLVDTIVSITTVGLEVDTLVDVEVEIDAKNASNYIIKVYEPSLGIGQADLLKHFITRNDSNVQAYLDYMVDVVKLFGADCDAVESEMKDVLDFTMSLANIMSSLDETSEVMKQYNKMTIRDLQALGDAINWKSLFSKLFDHVEITDNDYVIVQNPSFVQKVNVLIKRTSKKTIANYLLWSVTDSSVLLMDESFLKLKDAFDKVYHGRKERKLISTSCIEQINGRLSAALSALYATEYIPKKTKTVLSELGKNIRIEFRALLDNATWMDKITKKHALDKLESFRLLVAYPDELLDEATLVKYLEPIKFTVNHYENVRNLHAIEVRHAYKTYGTKPDKYHWTNFHSLANWVNALFYDTHNMVVFTGGILQYPFFDPESPKFQNYGSSGFFFGHELTHGFDNAGRHFDKHGNLINWWTNSSDQAFKEREKCMIEQYGKYSYLGHRLNGIKSLRENIADNGGLKQAYLAYTKVMDSDMTLEKLKKYTKKQLFWISTAQAFCSKYTQEIEEYYINNAFHTIDKYRVIGMLSNQAEFAEDFNCSASAAMNPSKKCDVW